MKHRYHKMISKNHSGFSLLEILIALVIVGILSVIAVNRYTSRTEEARISAAKAEEKALADAERQAEIDTGFFVTFRALDDEPGLGSFTDNNNFTQFKIQSEPIPYAIDTDGSFFTGTNFPFANWKGPYINYQSIYTTGNATGISAHGSPIDPWGNPYRLYTPLFLTNPAPGDETSFTTAIFDRMAIVSYGKDGAAGSPPASNIPGSGDDIIYKF